ncbi:MAG: tetratricopeptide repeat protein [Cyanobacteria bacterium P01_D01_bin.73]
MENVASLSDVLSRAWALLTTGNAIAAERIYQEVLKERPDCIEAYHGLALAKFEQGEHGEAIASIDRVMEAKSENPRHLNTAAWICQGCGEVDSALRHYKSALEQVDRSPQVQDPANQELREEVMQNLRSLVLFARDAYEEQVQYFLNEGDPLQAAELKLKIGNLCQEVEWIQHAIFHYRQGLEFCPVQADSPGATHATATYQANGLDNVSDVVDLSKGAACWQMPAPRTTTLQFGNDPAPMAIARNPIFALLYHQLGEAYLKDQQWEQAKAACQAALQISSQQPKVFKLLGNALMQLGQTQSAADAYQAALQLDGSYLDAWLNLGSALLCKNQVNEALECYQRAIAIDSQHAAAHWNMGLAYERAQKKPEALYHWQMALTINPAQQGEDGYNMLACQLLGAEKRNEGMIWHERNILRHPKTFKSYWEMCELLNTWSNFEQANRIADLFQKNASTPVMKILAGVMKVKILCSIGLNQEAREHYEAIEPDLFEQLPSLDRDHFVRIYVNVLFDVPHIRDDVARNSKIAEALGEQYIKNFDEQVVNALKKTPELEPMVNKALRKWPRRSPHRPLRLGFMSKHFRRHSVGWCSAQIFAELRKLTPHLFFYVTGDMPKDERTVLFEQVAEKFYYPNTPELPNLGTATIAKRVLSDQLDVLVDLDSITVLPHADVLHMEPAPVCITWLGYDAPHLNPNNYNLVDWHTHPAGVDRHYIEKLIRMPGAFAAINDLPISPTSRELQRRAFRIDDDQVIFLCVATGQKFSRAMVQAQINIIKQVPDSLLFFKSRVGDLELMMRTYHEECDRQGVRRSRIQVVPRTASEEEHRTVYLMCDVLLDSYPYSGATHNLEALYCNLPIVTRVGEQSFSRLGYSLIRAAGITEGTTWSWAEYIEWGVKLGRDRQLRDSIREKLKRGKEPGNLQLLWDPKSFAASMYQILEDLRDRVDGPQPSLPAAPTFPALPSGLSDQNSNLQNGNGVNAPDSGVAIASF